MLTALLLGLTCALASDDALRLAELPSPAEPGSGMPWLAPAPDGGLFLAWLDGLEGPGDRSARLRVARLGEDGWGVPHTVAEGEDWFVNWADTPTLTAGTGGALLATWLERLGDGTYAYGVRFALAPGAAGPWSEPRWLHEDLSAGEHGFVSACALEAGRFGALWLDGRAAAAHGASSGGGHGVGAMQLRYRTLDADGGLGPEELVDARVCDCCPTSLVRRADGSLLATYRDRSDADTDPEVRDVSLAWRDAGGWSAPEPVAEDGWELPGCPVNGPRAAARGGTQVAVWFTGAGGGASRVQARFAEDGVFGEPVELDEGVPEGRVDVVLLADGSAVVAWLEHTDDGPAWLARRVDAEGPRGPALRIAGVPAGRTSGHLRLAPFGRGLVAAWTDPRAGQVRTARILADG